MTNPLVAPPTRDHLGDMLATMTTTSPAGLTRLARLVKTERQAQGLRQDDLAQRAGVSRNTITQLEAGKVRSSKTLPSILTALGISVMDLLVDAPTPELPPPGSAPPLAHLTDVQLTSEASRLVAEMAARLASRPVATAVPAPGTFGVLSAVDPPIEDNHTDTAR